MPIITVKPPLNVEQKFDNVTVVHDVLLALGALQALGLDGGIVEVGVLQVFVRDDLRTDEAALKVAVDLAGSLRGLGALPDGPGAAFLLSQLSCHYFHFWS